MTEEVPKTTVVHVNDARFDVYVGRDAYGYKDIGYGNPFNVGKDGILSEVLVKYEDYARSHPIFVARIKTELRGKILGCWCRTDQCHAHILARVADED